MPRLDATTRLGRRGILAWRVDGVLARLTAKQSGKDDGLRNQVAQVIVSAGADTAAKIRNRVSKNGDLAGQHFPGYSTRGKYLVSPEYAKLARAEPPPWKWNGVDDTRERLVFGKNLEVMQVLSVRVFRNSQAFHSAAGTNPGTYSVTGGMWAGIQARGTGDAGVILDFAGSSPGQGRTQRYKSYRARTDRERGSRSSTVVGITAENVRNSDKAGIIYRQHKVHVLKMTNEELQAMGLRVTRQFSSWLGLQLKR